MYRLVLNVDSHYALRVYRLRDDTNFYKVVSDIEKKRTAKDILCFMFLLNSAHIQAYLQTISNAIENIKKWCSQIKDNSSFSVKIMPSSKKEKFGCTLFRYPLAKEMILMIVFRTRNTILMTQIAILH